MQWDKGHVWFGFLQQSQGPCTKWCMCVHREDGDSGQHCKDSVSLLLKIGYTSAGWKGRLNETCDFVPAGPDQDWTFFRNLGNLPKNPAHGKPLLPTVLPQGYREAKSHSWSPASHWGPKIWASLSFLHIIWVSFPEYLPGSPLLGFECFVNP